MKFIVNVEIPNGCTVRDIEDYIREAIKVWRGQEDPDMPISDLNPRKVTVKRASTPLITEMAIRLYLDWCKTNNCSHAHCPEGCEHPQPIVLEDGRCICGRCWVIDKRFTEVVPCSGETGC